MTSLLDQDYLDELRASTSALGSEVLNQLIDLFLDNAQRLLTALRQAVADGEVEAIRYTLHTLRSGAASVGAFQFAAGLRPLEQDPGSVGPAQLETIEADYQAVKLALEAERRVDVPPADGLPSAS